MFLQNFQLQVLRSIKGVFVHILDYNFILQQTRLELIHHYYHLILVGVIHHQIPMKLAQIVH